MIRDILAGPKFVENQSYSSRKINEGYHGNITTIMVVIFQILTRKKGFIACDVSDENSQFFESSPLAEEHAPHARVLNTRSRSTISSDDRFASS
jgi:hypothetical protein